MCKVKPWEDLVAYFCNSGQWNTLFDFGLLRSHMLRENAVEEVRPKDNIDVLLNNEKFWRECANIYRNPRPEAKNWNVTDLTREAKGLPEKKSQRTHAQQSV